MNKTFKAVDNLKKAMSEEDVTFVSVSRFRDRNLDDGTFLPDRFRVNVNKDDPWPWRGKRRPSDEDVEYMEF